MTSHTHKMPYALRQILVFISTTSIFYLLPTNISSSASTRGVVAVLLLCFLAYLITNQVRKQHHRIFTLLALMFVAVHTWAFICYALASKTPEEFTGLSTRTDALYFTVVTMSTVGFGDIHPVGQLAKILVIGMILFTLIFIGALGHTISETIDINRKNRHIMNKEAR